MRLRDSIALTLPSFLLRLVLGVTFIWAGTGKLIGTMQVSGDDAARLANLGVDLNIIEPEPTQGEPERDELLKPLPQDPVIDAPVESSKSHSVRASWWVSGTSLSRHAPNSMRPLISLFFTSDDMMPSGARLAH